MPYVKSRQLLLKKLIKLVTYDANGITIRVSMDIW